jgi:tRNA-dihydrouridine synthase B
MSFWQNLPKPIVGLAPMDGITDEPMRKITAQHGRPDVIFTEFINVEYVNARPEKLFSRFWYSANQRPIVAQLSGVNPGLFYQFAQIAAELGFDGVDINMGCPAKSVTSRGGGAKLINNRPLAKELVLAAKKGLEDWEKEGLTDSLNKKILKVLKKTSKKIVDFNDRKRKKRSGPALSVKTRLGLDKPLVEDWLGFLFSLPIEALIVHGRLLSAGHSGPVDWESLKAAAVIAGKNRKVFIGNGGIKSLSEGQKISQKYHLGGVLIGQAALGNPWVFTDKKPDRKKRLLIMMEHARYFVDCFGQENFLIFRKHLAWYASGFPGAKKLRSRLVRTNNLSEAKSVVENFLRKDFA